MLLALFSSSPVFAATLNVGSSQAYTAIQDAIDAASSGDTINVAAGTYMECIDFSGKTLEIVGAGSTTTEIDGWAMCGNAVTVDSGEGSGTTLEGFSISNPYNRGVYVEDSSLELHDVVIYGCGQTTLSAGGGLHVHGGWVGVYDSTVYYNVAKYGGNVYVSGGGDVEIQDSTVSYGQAYYGAGVFVDYDSTDGGSWLSLDGNNVESNFAYYNGGGLYGDERSTISTTGNTWEKNGGYYTDGSAIYVTTYSTLTVEGDTFDTNWADYYAQGYHGGAIYACNYSDVTSTDNTFTGNTAYYGGAVAAYFYTEFSEEGSLYEDNTGEGDGGALYVNQAYSEVTVENAIFDDNRSNSGYGGAIFAYYYSDLTVDDSEFSDNQSSDYGGAITQIYYGDLDVDESVFEDNTSGRGGGIFFDPVDTCTYDASLTDSTFEGNVVDGHGGGAYLKNGNAVELLDNTFEDNESTDNGKSGGGLYLHSSCELEARRNWFCTNTADNGGGAWSYKTSVSSEWTNNVFVENEANDYGGGLGLSNNQVVSFTNNTLVGNSATKGAALYMTSAWGDILNNIFAYGPAGKAVHGASSNVNSNSTFAYNDFFDNDDGDVGGTLSFSTTSNGNTTDQPDFVDYTYDGDCGNDDLHLAHGSDLIDAGDPSITDVDGTTSDIGAYGGPDAPIEDHDGDGYDNTVDCDDTDASTYPGAPETCDGNDNDCDGSADEGLGTDWYADSDGDSYGDPGTTVEDCAQPSGYVSNDHDCDDSEATVYPFAPEYCDGLNNDCDAFTDENAVDASWWWADVDGDGFGDASDETGACDRPTGYVDNDDDCDDTNSSAHPGAAEIWYDGVDEACDGGSDYDQDGDGYDSDTYGGDDCDDTDADVHPGANDAWYDGVDSDCAGNSDYDKDGDGHDSDNHGGDDCKDGNPSIHPGALEVCDNLKDDDCDGAVDEGNTWFYDKDGDGYGDATKTVDACDVPDGFVDNGDDCEDCDASINPGQDEAWYDGVDQDCDGNDDDQDGDGFVVTEDCDDVDPAIHPDALDDSADGIDQNCNGLDGEDELCEDPYDTGACDHDGPGNGPHDKFGGNCSSAPADGAPLGLAALLLGLMVRRRRA